MQRKIIIRIIIFSMIGLLLTTAITFFSQGGSTRMQQTEVAKTLLTQIEQKLADNEKDVEELTASLNKEYIEKAHAFARMIKLDPTILENSEELLAIQKELGVDELHVSDENGILIAGTIPGYFGFDFSSSEQSAPFMKILTDPSYELAQEPTLNGAEQKLFQYVGVSRQDMTGIVQVGITPSRLDEELANNQIDKVLNSYSYGSTGFVFAVDNSTGLIASYPDSSAIGKAPSELGIDASKETGEIKIDKEMYFYYAIDTETYRIVAMMPMSEMFSMRNTSTTVTTVIFAVIFAVLVFLISTLIKRQVISGIINVMNGVKEIAAGNLEKKIDVRTYEEFSVLSDGINTMVDNITTKMQETNILMDNQKVMIGEVAKTAKGIGTYSDSMTSTAKSISGGATTQAATVEQLSAFCESITRQVMENSENAKKASNLAEESSERLGDGMKMLEEMNNAMKEMGEASKNISQVIKTVSDIAFQTNILALNASVEAARAGVHGRGFAVVAEEVRNLAGKSAEAANNTTELIERTLSTVEKGQLIADNTSKAMQEILDETRESTRLIEEISTAATNQAAAINEISQGVGQISDVIQNNVLIASEAENTAEKLAEEATRLNRIVRG